MEPSDLRQFEPPTQAFVQLNEVRRNKPRGYEQAPRNMLPLIAFDPGQMTGWSLLVLKRYVGDKDTFNTNFYMAVRFRKKWEHGQIDCLDEDLGVYSMIRLCEAYPTAAVVCEDFILSPKRNERSRNLLSPVRIMAKLEHALWRVNRRMLLQQPALAKSTATDERLKNWGAYVPGLPHARDADRHALTFVRRCFGTHGSSTRNIAWPYAYDVEGNQFNGVWHPASDLIGG